MFKEYDHLSYSEKRCYNELLDCFGRFNISVKMTSYDSKTVTQAFKALLHDNPQFFWLSGNADITETRRDGVLEEILIEPELERGVKPFAIASMSQRFESIVNSIVSQAKKYKSAYEQVIAVHNYIVDSTDYVSNAPMRFNAYGTLIDRRAVCAGYAKAFMLILNCLGIKCGYASGWSVASGESHAWNYVELDNELYFIDVTWDDPTTIGDSTSKNRTMNYFCLTTKELLITHRISTEYHVPQCNGTKYNYYTYNRSCFDRYNYDEVARVAAWQLRYDNKFSVKFKTPCETDRAIKDLIDNNKVYKISGMTNRISYSKSRSKLILTVEKR